MFRIMDPKITRYTTTIDVPVHKPIHIYMDKDIYMWEESFVEMRDNAISSNEKLDHDKCRAVLKWAATCNGFLRTIANKKRSSGDSIEFVIEFSDPKDLLRFSKDFKICVKGSYMKL